MNDNGTKKFNILKFQDAIWGFKKVFQGKVLRCFGCLIGNERFEYTGELGYDGLNGTRKIGPSYAKSVVYI